MARENKGGYALGLLVGLDFIVPEIQQQVLDAQQALKADPAPDTITIGNKSIQTSSLKGNWVGAILEAYDPSLAKPNALTNAVQALDRLEYWSEVVNGQDISGDKYDLSAIGKSGLLSDFTTLPSEPWLATEKDPLTQQFQATTSVARVFASLDNTLGEQQNAHITTAKQALITLSQYQAHHLAGEFEVLGDKGTKAAYSLREEALDVTKPSPENLAQLRDQLFTGTVEALRLAQEQGIAIDNNAVQWVQDYAQYAGVGPVQVHDFKTYQGMHDLSHNLLSLQSGARIELPNFGVVKYVVDPTTYASTLKIVSVDESLQGLSPQQLAQGLAEQINAMHAPKPGANYSRTDVAAERLAIAAGLSGRKEKDDKRAFATFAKAMKESESPDVANLHGDSITFACDVRALLYASLKAGEKQQELADEGKDEEAIDKAMLDARGKGAKEAGIAFADADGNEIKELLSSVKQITALGASINPPQAVAKFCAQVAGYIQMAETFAQIANVVSEQFGKRSAAKKEQQNAKSVTSVIEGFDNLSEDERAKLTASEDAAKTEHAAMQEHTTKAVISSVSEAVDVNLDAELGEVEEKVVGLLRSGGSADTLAKPMLELLNSQDSGHKATQIFNAIRSGEMHTELQSIANDVTNAILPLLENTQEMTPVQDDGIEYADVLPAHQTNVAHRVYQILDNYKPENAVHSVLALAKLTTDPQIGGEVKEAFNAIKNGTLGTYHSGIIEAAKEIADFAAEIAENQDTVLNVNDVQKQAIANFAR